MKKINKLTLENFKFFTGTQEFPFEGKNVLMYGENGSGKSSIYWALYTFFQSSLKDDNSIKKYFDTTHEENLTNRFIKENEKSSISLELINENNIIDKPMIISKTNFDTNKNNNTQIQEAMKSSDFINFKLLSRLYDFKNPEQIDLFVMFEKEVLNYLFIDDLNLSTLWNELKIGLNPKPRMTDRIYKDFQSKIDRFNNYFESLIPTLSRDTNNFLKDDFNENIEISINYKKATYNAFIGNTKSRNSKTIAPILTLKIKLLNNDIDNNIVDRPHTFLNEAKLTAISLSLRFSILKNRLVGDLKVLVLDDLLISLDMSYRIEVINILEKHFLDFQLIIMTHDKGFYQLFKRKISTQDWNIYELYNQNEKQCVKESKTSFEKAKKLFEHRDYEATAHYLRKEAEEILKHYLDPNLKYINNEFLGLESLIQKVKKEFELHYIKSFDNFFKAKSMDIEVSKKIGDFEDDESLDPKTKQQLFQIRGGLFKLFIKYTEYKNSEVKIFEELKNIKDRVLNPSSHYSEAPIFRKEIEDAIGLVHRLKNFLKDKDTKNIVPQNQHKCTESTVTNEILIPEHTDTFIVDFKKDILENLKLVTNSEDLNKFLDNNISHNIENFSPDELEQVFDELRMGNKLNLLNLECQTNLIRLFNKKKWELDYKKIWCNFVTYLHGEAKIKDPLLIKKLKEKNILKINYDGYNNEYLDCGFLNIQQMESEQNIKESTVYTEDEEIPF